MLNSGNNIVIRSLVSALMIATVTGVVFSQEVVLNPGFIAGTARVGNTSETEIRRVQVTATSGSLRSEGSFFISPPVQSASYILTVQVEEGSTRHYSTRATVTMGDDG